jgi:hypothetical protein
MKPEPEKQIFAIISLFLRLISFVLLFLEGETKKKPFTQVFQIAPLMTPYF